MGYAHVCLSLFVYVKACSVSVNESSVNVAYLLELQVLADLRALITFISKSIFFRVAAHSKLHGWMMI